MIPPAAQRTMSQRAGSDVVEMAGSHSTYVAQPAVVADLIKRAATAPEHPAVTHVQEVPPPGLLPADQDPVRAAARDRPAIIRAIDPGDHRPGDQLQPAAMPAQAPE